MNFSSGDAVAIHEVAPEACLGASFFIDSGHPDVLAFARARTQGATGARERAVRLFYAIRDEIRYDPYSFDLEPEYYRASHTLKQGFGWCVSKSVLMAASCRAVGIPARLGYADVRNHLSSPKLLELMQSDVFIYHGYAELWLDGRWLKVTPVFNLALCERFGVMPQEFDGSNHSLMQEFDANGDRHMEYLQDRGVFADLPFKQIVTGMSAEYPRLAKFADERRANRDSAVGDSMFSN